ncbi:hypothetical protein NDU88_009345 [Pleurodeles waltl]|uniref:Extracellular calcium-sensing receptor n=1 Tax=Pleurodeles waltl TaxID=8319 RepID=A0AAV7NZ04_PLEWA|nr:hypothetical protein NDU88_009345 [Pleurodeles waltl]
MRTVPANSLQIVALARLMKHFGWKWIAVLTSDDEVGVQGGQDLKKSIEKNGGCVAFMDKIHLSYSTGRIRRLVETLQEYKVKVIIIHSSEVHTKMFLETLASQNVSDKVLVFSESFTLTPGLFRKEAWRIFNGSIALSPRAMDMPGFEQHLHRLHLSRAPADIFINIFWEKVFKCKWGGLTETSPAVSEGDGKAPEKCSGNETIGSLNTTFFEMSDLSFTYHTYLAAYAFANALHSLMSCKMGHGPFINRSCGNTNDLKPWQVFHYVKNYNFQIRNGQNISFDINGDAPGAYDIRNAQMHTADEVQLVKVGYFDPGQGEEVHVNMSIILWSRGSQVPRSVCSESCPSGYRQAVKEGKPACCFDCVPCSQGEIANNANTLGQRAHGLKAKCRILQVYHRKPCLGSPPTMSGNWTRGRGRRSACAVLRGVRHNGESRVARLLLLHV